MPSTTWHVAVWLLIATVVAYSVVVTAQPLLGVFFATMIYGIAWLMAVATPRAGFRSQLSTVRAAATGILVVVVLLYSLLVAAEVLLGVLTSVLLVVVSWVTSPRGPIAAWLRGDSGDDAEF